MSIRAFNIGAMFVHMIELDGLRAVAQRCEMHNISDKLIRHYLRGGVPNGPRYDVIAAMWCEMTGLTEAEAPMFDWAPAYRVDTNRQTQREHCPTCGQVLRGKGRVIAWQQLQLHQQTHGAPEAAPAWLSPRPVQRADFQGSSRVVRAADDEPVGSLL